MQASRCRSGATEVSCAIIFISRIWSIENGIFNVGSGEGYSLTDILAKISVMVGVCPVVQHHPQRRFDISRLVLDISQAHKTFGWNPRSRCKTGWRVPGRQCVHQLDADEVQTVPDLRSSNPVVLFGGIGLSLIRRDLPTMANAQPRPTHAGSEIYPAEVDAIGAITQTVIP